MKCAVLTPLILLVFFSCTTPPETKPDNVVFYPPLPLKPRVQFLHAISGEEDIGKTQSALEEFLLGQPEAERRLGKSYDISASAGKIYVLDRRVKRMIIVDLANRKFDHIRQQRLGKLIEPSGIWVTPDDTKYVADMQRKQIVVFDANNDFLKTYGDEALFEQPVDVAVHQSNIYVCDIKKHQIFVLDKDTGSLKGTIGEYGRKKEGYFYKPTHVVVDQAGNIFVNDAFNYRIQKFDPEGRFLQSYGFLGDNLGAFVRPKGLAVDKEGHLYVADAAFENVQIFDDQTARLLLFIGGPGTTPGSMYLPSGVHIDYLNTEYFSKFADKDFKLKYLLYVGNMFGQYKLNVYGFGEWIGQ